MTIATRLQGRLRQYRIESAMLAAAFRSLAVNLEFMERLGLRAASRVVVVDSWREATLLRVLGSLHLVRRCTVHVVTRAEKLAEVATAEARAGRPIIYLGDPDGEIARIILTMRVCSRHYQTVAELRRRATILVI